MSKRKKVTYKELTNDLGIVIQRMAQIEKGLDYMHSLLISYIECNKDQDKLKKFLEKEIKDGQTDGSSSEANRSNKSGDKKTDGKSGKPRESTTEKGNKDKT